VSGTISGTVSASVSATATATSTATDLRPVIAAAQAAAQLSAQDESTGIISGSTLIGILLGFVVLWVVGATTYSFIKKRRLPKVKTPMIKSTIVNPMLQPHPLPSEEIQPHMAQIQSSPPLRASLEDFTLGKPAILSVSTNSKIVSGIVHTPITLPSPQLKPRMPVFERRDLQVFQATTVRNMRAGSRMRQLKREDV
jgi:hypothetical protein